MQCLVLRLLVCYSYCEASRLVSVTVCTGGVTRSNRVSGETHCSSVVEHLHPISSFVCLCIGPFGIGYHESSTLSGAILLTWPHRLTVRQLSSAQSTYVASLVRYCFEPCFM